MVTVAPFAGAWIEIAKNIFQVNINMVAPFAGAWIEISLSATHLTKDVKSLPSRERGLKYDRRMQHRRQDRRSLRGSVD